MILYEYPFNEKIRTWLRLDRLFITLGTLIKREDRVDHHYALNTMFEIMDIAGRSDLKTDIMAELEQQKRMLEALSGNPEISEKILSRVIEQIQTCIITLNQHTGLRIISELSKNNWLMSIRKRMSIPGGICEFDLPSYHAWLHLPVKERLANLYEWVAQLAPLADAITNLLRIYRDSGVMQKSTAPQGQLELPLPSSKNYSLLRVMISKERALIPEISVNRMIISVRWLKQDDEWKTHPVKDDVHFELALCS